MNKNPTRYYSRKQEEYVANYLGGRLTPNSGATAFQKGDIVYDTFAIIECKTKEKEVTQVAIKKEWIETLKQESFNVGRPYWSIIFDFGKVGDEYAIIPLNDYKEFLEYKKGCE